MAELSICYPGPFFAGAVAPDVDKLLGTHRSSTHWWQPGSDLSGAVRLVHAKPRLAHVTPGSSSQAFVAGYLCHLVTDEQWTLRIYRRHFGRLTPFAGSRDGADHQLALQSALDTELVTQAKVGPAITKLSAHRVGDFERDAAPVLGGDAWALRPFVTSVMRRASEPDPALRLKLMAEARVSELTRTNSERKSDPMIMTRTTDNPELLHAFIARLPSLVSAAFSLISMQEIDDFRASAIRASAKLIGEFVGGEPLTSPEGTSAAGYFGSPARTDL